MNTDKVPHVPRLLSVSDVMHALSCSRSTVNRLMDSGTLKSIRIGGMRRIREDEIARLIKGAT